METKIHYRRGYKYQLVGNHIFYVDIRPEESIKAGYVQLNKAGVLRIKSGYAWDGCSGPTWDSGGNMRAGLIHDALYQIMRLGLLPQTFKEAADRELQKAMKEDGAWGIRAWYYYKAVKMFGGKSCQPGHEPYPVLVAP